MIGGESEKERSREEVREGRGEKVVKKKRSFRVEGGVGSL